MPKLNDEEIMLLAAMLATQRTEPEGCLEDTCLQVQTNYLKFRQVFKDMNKVDLSLSSILSKGK